MATENEIKSWLEIILKSEKLEDISVNIYGRTEPDAGFTGDIFFVEVNGTTEENVNKKYNLAVKCAKRSTAFRSKFPVNCAFLSEIYFYETVFPYFLRFQREKGVGDPFNKLAKCYGSLIADDLEVIVLDDLSAQGFTVWDKKTPLTRERIELIVAEYGKLHAISIALRDQQPEKFQRLIEKCGDYLSKIYEYTDLVITHEELVDELCEHLQGELDEVFLSKWKNLKPKIRPFIKKFQEGLDRMNIVIHGDCWINNFLHHRVDNQPPKFAIIDWQNSMVGSPIIDLSYFLFSCISEEDINDVDVILKLYYTSLTDHLRKLGSSVHKLYPYNQFLEEWKNHCKFGILMSTVVFKMGLTEKEKVPDFVQVAEDGLDVATSIAGKVKDASRFKERLRYLIKYYAEHDLI